MESEMGPEAGREAVEPSADSTPFAPVDPAPPLPGPPPLPSAPPLPSYPPPSPYGYPPYTQYGYGTPVPPRGSNGMAVASLVLGICGFFFVTPIVGLVLGVIALSAVKKSGQRGKGMAIWGIVLSSVWMALFATLITVVVVATPDPARRDADGTVVKKGAVPIFGLRPKDCFTIPPDLLGRTDSHASSLTVVPCSTAHDSEAIGSFTAAENSFPGVDALRAESTAECIKVLSAYVPDAGSVPAGSLVQYLYPNSEAWDSSKHRVTCFLQFRGAALTQSVHRDMASYTADQQRYLNAVHPLIDAVTRLNGTPESAGLADLQERARDIAAAGQSEIAALTAAPWPADVQPAVDAVVAAHRDAARLWTQAASATDVTAFQDAARKADAAYGLTALKSLRTALALTTITPGPAA